MTAALDRIKILQSVDITGSITIIDYKCMVPGYTCMEYDSDHALIEKKEK